MTETLWSPGASPDAQMLAYTIGDDREIDTALLRWDVLGSLGHLEALHGGGIVTARDHAQMRRALRAAVTAVEAGELTIEASHEDGHSAVEFWLTTHHGEVGTRLHAGRSRNDQVALDLRLHLRHESLAIHAGLGALADSLLKFATRHRRVIWPGYTHQRIAMPSSASAWAAGYAEQLLDTMESYEGLWPRLDRSPLGSAAGYGAPLPLDREAAAQALGFGGLDQVVTTVQNARGQLEAAVLFWCLDGAHALAKLATDVILYSSDEFGWLTLPVEFSTGSSIMPQKRNPDLFELTRGRAAALEGDFHTVMAIKRGLPGGYHRDFQLLKAPTLRGIGRTREMLGMLTSAVPALGVDPGRAAAALRPEVFATDEAMRRVRAGQPFREAYRAVANELKQGEGVPVLHGAEVLAHRDSTGGLGNLGIAELRRRLRSLQRTAAGRQRRIARALDRLTG